MAMLQDRLVVGTVQPTLDLKLRMRAEPLTRLVTDGAEWLARRKAHIRSSTERPPDPPPPPPQRSGRLLPDYPFAGIAGLMGGRYATGEDAKEFETRVRRHLQQARAVLMDNVVQRIVRSNENEIVFDVHNHTDDPIEKVELTVRVPKEGVSVFTSTPSAKPMPELPRWPEQFEQTMRVPADNPYNYDISRGASVVRRGDFFEVTFDVGDLRPGQLFTTQPMTIVVGGNSPDVIPVEVVAAAMNRRGDKRVKTSVKVIPLDDGGRWTAGSRPTRPKLAS